MGGIRYNHSKKFGSLPQVIDASEGDTSSQFEALKKMLASTGPHGITSQPEAMGEDDHIKVYLKLRC